MSGPQEVFRATTYAPQEVYRATSYAPERVTGRYLQRRSAREGGGYRVAETATGTGRFSGRPGYGPTLREYVTDGAEIPELIRERATDWQTVQWPLDGAAA